MSRLLSSRPLVLFVGQVKVIERGQSPVIRVAVGHGGLLKANVVDHRQIVLLGEAAGETTVHLWMKDGSEVSFKVHIRAQDLDRIRHEVQSLLSDLPEVSVRVLGARVLIEGQVRHAVAAAKVRRIAALYPEVSNQIPDEWGELRVVRRDPMIYLDLRVVEVRKRALEQLGIQWSHMAEGPAMAAVVRSSPGSLSGGADQSTVAALSSQRRAGGWVGMATQLTSVIQLLEQRGDSWTLAEPRLSCKSGGKSRFVAGGEVPIPVSAGMGQTSVVYKQYGVVIEFNPVSDAEGNIESGIEVEVSEPDPRNSNQGFVAFTTHRTSTQVVLKHNTPIVISGLLRQQSIRSMEGVPGLSQLPVIGGMFRSRDGRGEETELLVVVTPRLFEPQSPLNTETVERAQGLVDQHRSTVPPPGVN